MRKQLLVLVLVVLAPVAGAIEGVQESPLPGGAGSGGGTEIVTTKEQFEACASRPFSAVWDGAGRLCRLAAPLALDHPDSAATPAMELKAPANWPITAYWRMDFAQQIITTVISAGDADDATFIRVDVGDTAICPAGDSFKWERFAVWGMNFPGVTNAAQKSARLVELTSGTPQCELEFGHGNLGLLHGLGCAVGPPSLPECQNETIHVSGGLAVDFRNTLIATAGINPGVDILSIDSIRIQSGITFSGDTQIRNNLSPNDPYCFSFSDATNGKQIEFVRAVGSRKVEAIPYMRACGIYDPGNTGSHYGAMVGPVRWSPADSADCFYTLGPDSGDNMNSMVDVELWLNSLPAGCFLRVEDGGNDPRSIEVGIHGNALATMTNFIQHGVGVTTNLETLKVESSTGTTPWDCTDFADANARTDYAEANQAIGRVETLQETLRIDYRNGNECL